MTAREDFAAAVDRVLALRDADPGCIGDSDVQAILAAADEYRASGLREFAGALSEMAHMARPGTPVRGALMQVAEMAAERAVAVQAPLAAAPATREAPAAQRGSQPRRGWDQ